MIMLYTALLVLFSLWLILNLLFMPRPSLRPETAVRETVTVLVPLRNEEKNAEALIRNLKKLKSARVRFLFLDDSSEDATLSLLRTHTADWKEAAVLNGRPLPPGWTGKNFACHQLAEKAETDYLCFIDADVRLAPEAIAVFQETARSRRAKMLTGFPKFPVSGILASLLVPMQHFVIALHLPLLPANYTTRPIFTAAHGAFIFAERAAYQQIGGHASVKGAIVDDVALARQFKSHGHRSPLMNITEYVTCYMYETSRDVWEGFGKNIFPGIGRSYFLAALLTIFYTIFFILPLPLFIYGAVTSSWIFCLPFLFIIFIKWYVDIRFRQKKWLCLFMPFSAISLIAVLFYSIYLTVRQKGYTWKGRTYQ